MFGTPAASTAFTIGFGFRGVAAQRLLAHHHLAGLGGGDGDLGVRVVRARDIDEVDLGRLDHFAPVGLGGFVPPFRGEALRAVGIARADGFQDRLVREVEEIRRPCGTRSNARAP